MLLVNSSSGVGGDGDDNGGGQQTNKQSFLTLFSLQFSILLYRSMSTQLLT